MGKRSNFERREADFYPTPRAAVVPLIPYLRRGIRSFAEPCAGDGALVRHLEGFGLRCVYAGDIRSGQDALALDQGAATDNIPPTLLARAEITLLGGAAVTWPLMAPCAAAGDAGSRVPWHPIARRNGRPCARIAPGPERNGHFEEHVWRVGDILMWDNRCTLHAHRLQRGRAPPDAASDDPRREAAMSRPQYRLRSSSSVRCPCCRGRCGAASCRTASRPD